MKKLTVVGIAAVGALLVMRYAVPQQAAHEQVGALPDGGFLLNSGWLLHPAGEQVAVGTFPMSSAVSQNGRYLLALNGGYDPPSISVIDIAQKKEVGRTPLPDAWLGLKVAPAGNLVYVGGGVTGKVFELSLDDTTGALTQKREFVATPDPVNKGNVLIGDVALSVDAHILYAADVRADSVAVINLQSGEMTGRWKTGQQPYRILPLPGGRDVLVSSWADGAIYQHEATSGQQGAKIRVGPHPTDMLLIKRPPPTDEGGESSSYTGRLFVTASNTNNTYVFGMTADHQLTPIETINISLTPMHPLGMTPSALASDAKGNNLFVVCSDANAVAEVDITSSRSRVAGFIPTGWYPTAINALSDGRLAIVNGKGLGSHPNPRGPNPMKHASPKVEYVGHIQTGTVAFLPAPDEETLPDFTQTVVKNSPYKDDILYSPVTDGQQNYFARSEGHESPIKHVIYVIKENRTYDQVLGDMDKGNGDKSLNLFGEQVTPNLHQLARDYILYDNFYENADVSAEGHNWASAAIAPDYTVKTWPSQYGHRSKVYDFEGGEPANTPPAGYLWNNALQAGVSFRDYGQWVTNIPLKDVTGTKQIGAVKDPSLALYVDMNYRGFDLQYADVDRAKEFVREWKEFGAKNEAPNLLIVRMGNDHTQGARAGAFTPLAYNADNDYAVGLLVDAVSHSKLWETTAIFVTEDDSQNGPDHVDSHRAPAWVISPYTRRGLVDSTMYNQMSVLRTIELIAGLRPMTHFDAGARPMFSTFSRQPDNAPFNVIQPKIPLTDRNSGHEAGAAESARMDFRDADETDDNELNAVMWRAVKHSDPPPPTHSAFGR